jgi:hypothetical protein
VAQSYINQIQNKDITANCDAGTGVCTVAIQDFPIQLQTPCKAGDCVSARSATLNQGASPLLLVPSCGSARMCPRSACAR